MQRIETGRIGEDPGHPCKVFRRVGGQIDRVPEDVVVRPLRIEDVVAVEVLGIGVAVVFGAPRAEVAPAIEDDGGTQIVGAERWPTYDAVAGTDERIGAITEDADIVDRGTPRAE